MKQPVHSTSDDNNLALFYLQWIETILKHKKVSDILSGFVGLAKNLYG